MGCCFERKLPNKSCPELPSTVRDEWRHDSLRPETGQNRIARFLQPGLAGVPAVI